MNKKLVKISELARQLQVSIRWLRTETDAGRIPHLQAGKYTLYDIDAVRDELVKLANKATETKRPTILGGSNDS